MPPALIGNPGLHSRLQHFEQTQAVEQADGALFPDDGEVEIALHAVADLLCVITLDLAAAPGSRDDPAGPAGILPAMNPMQPGFPMRGTLFLGAPVMFPAVPLDHGDPSRSAKAILAPDTLGISTFFWTPRFIAAKKAHNFSRLRALACAFSTNVLGEVALVGTFPVATPELESWLPLGYKEIERLSCMPRAGQALAAGYGTWSMHGCLDREEP